MFEKGVHECPSCGGIIREVIKDGTEFSCHLCRKRFLAVLNRDTGTTAFINLTTKKVPEPLYLPRGSIRALATLAMAVTCWVMLLRGQDVPEYLFGLVLTIIGYYFGLRKHLAAAQSRIYDGGEKALEPLNLPAGFIRLFLVAGFAISAVALYRRGNLDELKYLEFFVVLFGLILGYLFGKFFSKTEGGGLYILFNHVKGVVVIGAVAVLAFLLLSGRHVWHTHEALALSSVISFYFGSRS